MLKPVNYDPDVSKDASKNVEADIREFGLLDDCPLFTGLSDYVPMVGGATLTAAASLKTMDISICWDGGRSALKLQS